jgi:predicted nucleotide-binding protein
MDIAALLGELRALRAQGDAPEMRTEGPSHTAWRAKADAILRRALGEASPTLAAFRSISFEADFWTGSPGEFDAYQRVFADGVARACALIDAAIYEVEIVVASESNVTLSKAMEPSGKVFVVHGRDDATKYQLLRVLDRATNLEAIVLHEQTNEGNTILEKLDHHARAADFAVVLVTADDEGRLRGGAESHLMPRGRQNVIFEAGMLIGLLGRRNVAIIVERDVERPSDLDGVVYIELDSAGAWKQQLAREISAAGHEIRFERIP